MYYSRCKNIRHLFSCCERLMLKEGSGRFLFRGQPDSRYGLQPSIYRRIPAGADPREFERTTLTQLKGTTQYLTMLPDELRRSDEFLLALAQHYGTPTRLLDWTTDPDVAIYFALSSALREDPVAPMLSVFAVGDVYLDVSLDKPSAQVDLPRVANPNLVAQRGILTKEAWGHTKLWDWSRAKRVDDAVENVSGRRDSRLIRFDLSTTEIEEGLGMLASRGVRAWSLFPGESGLARDAEDEARLAVLKKSLGRSRRTRRRA